VKLYLMAKVMLMHLKFKVLLVKTCDAVSELELILMVVVEVMMVDAVVLVMGDFVEVAEFVSPLDRWRKTILLGR
jgi:hypothetical protein